MGRLAAAVVGALVASASGRRLTDPSANANLATSPWAPSAQLRLELPRSQALYLAEAWHRASPGDEDDKFDSTSRHFAELLGLHDRPAESADLEGDLAELLGLRDRPGAPPDFQRDGDDVPDPCLQHLATTVGMRGGHMLPAYHFATPLIGQLKPLYQRVDFPMKFVLLNWIVYDKFRRALKHMVPKPFIDECEGFFRVVAGVELQALEVIRSILERAPAREDSCPAVREAHASALRYLAEDIRSGVQESADYAMSVGKGTFAKLRRRGERQKVAVHGLSLRIADAVRQDEDGNWKPVGKFVDLPGGKALEDVAEIDVTQELVPERVQTKARLKLLGLVASLGHESVFRKVQEALWRNEADSRIMSIDEFKAKMGVDGSADLVKKLIHKYNTPRRNLHAFMFFYSMFPLRGDPKYFQISWGIRLASHFAAMHSDRPSVQYVAKRGFEQFFVLEARFRGRQMLNVVQLAQAGAKLTTFQHLQAAHGLLTLMLFVYDKHYLFLQ